MADYTTTIGIECHVQFKTVTKLFSAVGNDARDASPNTLISHIDLGMPGALPVLNAKAVELGIRAAFALNTEPQKFSKFDRKQYFYPDLPMGYQITQFYNPIIKGGSVAITVDGKPKTIRIHEAHLEADAGKSTHPTSKDYSLVDLNRAGTPLLEIVSEPDMHTAAEAKTYAKELYLLMRYADVSDASLYYGNMRFDVNVSISKTDKLGTRTETKNLNSFRAVEKAVEYEVKRQTELLNKGIPITQETRGWDDAKQKTFSQRSKEEAHDYRYMPEPDIPPIELTEAMLKPVRQSMPVLPQEYRETFKKAGIDTTSSEILLGAPDRARLVSEVFEKYGSEHAKRIANLAVNSVETLLGDALLEAQPADIGLEPVSVKPEAAVKLSEMVAGNELSSTAAKKIWIKMTLSGEDPRTIAKKDNLLQVSDEGAIDKIVAEVLKTNAQAANDVKNGEMKAIGFLVGQVMKESKGQANPQLAQQLIKKHLGL